MYEGPDRREEKRFSFDPTINLGHLLTFIGFLATGFGAYATLDKRLSVQESKRRH